MNGVYKVTVSVRQNDIFFLVGDIYDLTTKLQIFVTYLKKSTIVIIPTEII
jgi:hypothetical protein